MSRAASAGIYDYILGGPHHTELERRIGDEMIRLQPTVAKAMRLQRKFLRNFIEEHGGKYFIDLATGYPSEATPDKPDEGYPHTHLPPSSKIIYNDIDPEVVEEARRIVGDRPNIRYIQSDIADIDAILEAADSLFGGEREVTISMVGVSYFLKHHVLADVLHKLFVWAAPGSTLGITTFVPQPDDPGFQRMAKQYEDQGTPVYPRSRDEILALANGWQLSPEGFLDVEVFVENRIGRPVAFEDEREKLGYVAVLTHP